MRALLSLDTASSESLLCSDALVERLVDNGLGPIAHHAVGAGCLVVSNSAAESLLAADLTARAIASSRNEVIKGIVRAFAACGVRCALLKGASVASHYAQHHWRVMSDIDILVDGHALEQAVALLRSMGFTNAYPEPDEHWETHHHAAPMIHPAGKICVELHHSLDSSEWFDLDAFHASSIWQDSTRLTLYDSPVYQLNRRLELNYLAAHWYLHLIENPDTPGLQRALFDVAFLLRGTSIDANCFLPVKRLCFPSLTLLSVMARLGVVSLDERLLSSVVQHQQIDRAALDYCAMMIDNKICTLEPAPRTLVMEIQSSCLQLALVNDVPALFHWRRVNLAKNTILKAVQARATVAVTQLERSFSPGRT